MHEKWMELALQQAKLGEGLTSPNPSVGAVVVKNNCLLGKGFHQKAGAPHAEREAISDALKHHPAENLKGASIYITLEPCSTTGKTPPCTDAILKHGIQHVFYGSTDPNPSHKGAAKMLLSSHSIEVTSGVLEAECDAMIKEFSKKTTTGLPWVIAKTAMSLDGKISRPPGESQWLTSPESRKIVHQLRAKVDAIIIGGKTLRKDNPRLTVRLDDCPESTKQQPYRAVITHQNRASLPQDSHLFTDQHKDRTLLYQDSPFIEILKDLGEKGCNSVLLECGGGLMGQWFDQGLVDECYFFLAPLITGGENLAVAGKGVKSNESAINLKNIMYQKIGNDVLASGLIDQTKNT